MKEKFVLKHVVNLKEMAEKFAKGGEVIVNTSDLSLQDGENMYQFEYKKSGKEKRALTEIFPGVYNITPTNAGIKLFDLELKEPDLLEIGNHTEVIMSEFEKFFANIKLYEKYNRDPRRNFLLYGAPGVGKSSSIVAACLKEMKKDKGVVVINWNSSNARSSDVMDFFQSGSFYNKKVTKVIILVEDIGMTVEGYGGPKEIDRSLLNFLDGVAVSFKIPTIIVATTNHVQNLPENLVNRPGRFDKHIKIDYPTAEQRVALYRFISKEELSAEDEALLKSSKCNDFTTAHLSEVFIRSKIDKKTLTEVVDQLYNHAKLFKKGFNDKQSIAHGLL